MIVSNFINEIGNKIKIKIKSQRDFGVNEKTKETIFFKGVNITMFSPVTTHETVVTHKEAEELFYALKKFLNK